VQRLNAVVREVDDTALRRREHVEALPARFEGIP